MRWLAALAIAAVIFLVVAWLTDFQVLLILLIPFAYSLRHLRPRPRPDERDGTGTPPRTPGTD